MFWVWREVLLERHPACILLPPPFFLLSTLYVHQEWWASRRFFWCYKGGLVIFCTITDGRRAEWGKWWSSLGLYIFGIGQDLEICFGLVHLVHLVHFLLMVMVGLYIPTQGVQWACSCLPNAESQCSVGFVFVAVGADGFCQNFKARQSKLSWWWCRACRSVCSFQCACSKLDQLGDWKTPFWLFDLWARKDFGESSL